MRTIYHSISVILIIAGLSVECAVAQKDTTKLNQSVEVMKAYRPSISNANKVNLLPVTDDTIRFTPEFKYSIDSKPIKNGFTASPIGAADVNGLQSKNLGLGYLKLGFGNYSTPYGELFLNVPKSKIGTFGFHLRHLSSDSQVKLSEGDKVDAPYSQNSGELFGTVNMRSTILSGELSYNRDAMKYYGYPAALPANPSILPPSFYGTMQAYQNMGVKIGLKSNDVLQNDLKFEGGLRLDFFDAKTGQKETSGGLFGKFDYNFGQVNVLLDITLDHLATDFNLTGLALKSENWVRIAPSVRLASDNWSMRGGINFVGVSVKNEGNTTRLYPDFEFNFRPIEETLTLYAGFKGDLKNNSYSDIANENYWSEPHHIVNNTDYTYIISGGLKGKISREFSYNVGLKYSQVKDLYFYVQGGYPDFSSSTSPAPILYNNAFDTTYDNGGIFNLSGEFSYVSGKDLSVVLKGNYYNYNLENLKFAPQMPAFDLSVTAGFRIIDRLTGFTDFEVIGERKALVYISPSPYSISSSLPIWQIKELSIDPVFRLNFGAAYDLTSQFKLFGRVDNLLNRQNEQWLGYASQGLRLIAGATFSF